MLPNDPRALLDRLLDRGYTQSVAPVVNAIAGDLDDGGLIRQRLKELEAEAERLRQAGLPLTPDNPVLRALRADLSDAMDGYAQDMNGVAGDVSANGAAAAGAFVYQTTLPGVDPSELAAIGLTWVTPNVDAVAALVNYVSLPAWQAELAGYGVGVDEVINNIAIRGFIDGWGALRIVREIAHTVDVLPMARMNSLIRTLQLYSFRTAAAAHQLANADILEPYAIRVAVLDQRVCMACLIEHGSEIPLGSVVDDHRGGRCFSITQVRGRPRNIQSGTDWFEGLTPEQQRAQMGNAAYEAWQAGAITLQDLVATGVDPIFGQYIHEASLVSILGGAAEEYY